MNARKEREAELNKLLSGLLDREWTRILKPVLLKRTGLYIAEIDAQLAIEREPNSDLYVSPTHDQDWAVAEWKAQVSQRPLVNVHRRTLDDVWRQVIRHFGGDDVVLCGPRHDDLLTAATEPEGRGNG